MPQRIHSFGTPAAAGMQVPSAATPAISAAKTHRQAPCDDVVRVQTPSPTLASRRVGGGDLLALRATCALTETVSVNANGFCLGRRHSRTEAGVTQGTAALLLQVARELGPLGPAAFVGHGVTVRTRRAIATHLQEFLSYGSARTGRTSLLGVKARAAAFALLAQLAHGMSAAGEAELRQNVVAKLLDAAGREPNEGLKRHMHLVLDALPASAFSMTQRAERRRLLDGVLQSSLPYQAWFGNDPKPTLNVRQYVMAEEGFFKNEIKSYRDAGFAISGLTANGAVATKLLVDPNGVAAPVQVRVELKVTHDNVLEAADDPKVQVILYSGHAQLGGVARFALQHGPKTERGAKFIGFFACRGKQWLHAVRRRYAGAQVLVSQNGTYDHDDKIVTQALYRAIAARADFNQMRRDVESHGVWERNNYIYPNDMRALDHLDFDGDGMHDRRADTPDYLYTPHIARGACNSVSFKPAARIADLSTLEGARITEAVEWFNTVHFYWAEGNGSRAEKAVADRFIAGGWFESNEASEVVRINDVLDDHHRQALMVQVNARYSHLSAEALGMLVTFKLGEAMGARFRASEPESERRLRALAMMGSYASCLVEYSDVADRLFANFAKAVGFPPTLTWPVVEKAVNSDSHGEESEKVMRALERGMQYPFLEVNPASRTPAFRRYVGAALQLLKRSKSEVGRQTYELLVTGKIRLDSLGDMTPADFLRLRKELLVDGIDLGDVAAMHEPRALRAITSSIDGYAWDNRIYVANGLSAQKLAEILVHEVNHVLNKSEEHYRGKHQILEEEYRANYAEALFRGEHLTRARCLALKERVISLYGLEGIDPNSVADLPPGVFV